MYTPPRTPRPSIKPRHALRSVLAVALLLASLTLVGGIGAISQPAPAEAAPGSPGTPGAPTVVYVEDFENGTGATTVGLGDYVGVGGQTYTADPYWLGYANCNGVILQYANPTFSTGHCSNDTFALERSRNNVRRLADVLGQVAAGAPGGTLVAPTNASNAASQTNQAVTGWTAEISGGNDLVQFESSDLNLTASTARYYSLSVDVAEASCAFLGGANNSRLNFTLAVGGTERPVNTSPIRACTDPAAGEYTSPLLPGGWFNGGNSIRAGTFFSDGGIQLTPAEIADLRIIMRNETGQQAGNDSAFDNITLVDSTPQLDKSFDPVIERVGQSSTLTFTITNRSDLGQKLDWGFTDALPAGLVIAATPNIGGTCTQVGGTAFTVTATGGTSTIAVTGGDLATGDEACTITVDVTSATSATYTNGPANMTELIGLDAPADATVRFIDPAISLTKTPDLTSFDAEDQTITYTFVATNTGDDPLTDVTITDPLPGLSALDCTPATPAALDPGETVTCTATYDTSQADVDAGSVDNTATATGTDETDRQVSDTDDATVPAVQSPAIELVKDADLTVFDAVDETITYSFTATNIGNVTLTGVTVTDPLPGLSAVACTPAAPATLAPGDQIECSATYDTTLADLDAGRVDNTATATGDDPNGDPVTDTDDATVPGEQTPAIDLTKSADLTSFSADGETITYTFDAQNVGNTTLNDVTIDDPLPGLSALDCTPAAPATLEPGEHLVCTATYDTTQGDLDAGGVDNTATVEGLGPDEELVTDTDDATVPAARINAIELVKDPDLSFFSAPDQTITYTFTGTNIGNTTLTGVTVTDPLPGLSTLACTPAAPATLEPGDAISCTATYDTTQGDLDAGGVDNTATIDGVGPDQAPVSDTADATVPADQRPEITVVKDADLTVFDAVDDTITYSFTATNTGNVTLSDVTLSDPLPGLSALACTPATPLTLAPGDSVGCTATYDTTQGDLDAGSVDNTVTATGDDPNGDPVTDTDDATVPAVQTPGIDLVKSADLASYDAVDDTITYTFTGTNTGNVTLTDVEITDPLPGLSALACTPAAPATLAPGEQIDCTATYDTTQGDLDAGSVDNTATITGDDPTGDPVTDTDDATVPGIQLPAIELVKDADLAIFDQDDQTITYTFSGTNTGNVTLTDVTITDPLPGLSALACTPTAPATLAPGESIECFATYDTTQGDVDAGRVDNTATITGDDPNGDPVTDTDDATVPGDQTPVIELTKRADLTSFDATDETITYTFEATNIGNVTLTEVTIDDPLPGLSTLACTPTAPATLEPGDAISCTATYDTTQSDLDAGVVDNVATATGQGPGDETVSDTDEATVPAAQQPAIELVKDADLTELTAAGDTVTYGFTATNTGNVTLTDVEITDPLPGLSALDCTPAAPATLAPGDAISCTATYDARQGDLDAGTLTNVATATGTDPGGDPVSDDDTVDIPATQQPGIELIKSVDKATYTVADQTLTYTFEATNTGNVTLTDVSIVDPLPGLSALGCNPTAPATLAPGATLTCTATYQVTQGDLDTGSIANTAIATGDDPGGDPVSDDDTVTIPAEPAPALDLVKQSDTASVSAPGDIIEYRFTATNNGNVTLTDVAITDPLPGLSTLDCTPAAPATLAPGEAQTCTASYEVTQADLDAGQVDNVATATGTDPQEQPLTDTDTVRVPADQDPAIELTKTVDLEQFAPGDTLTYTFEATNTGNVTLTGVTIADPLDGLSELTCDPTAPATLAPGETIACTATYVATDVDATAREIRNRATTTGTDPSGSQVTDDDDANVPVDPSAISDDDGGPGNGDGTGTDTGIGQIVRTGTDARTLAALGATLALIGIGLTRLDRRRRTS